MCCHLATKVNSKNKVFLRKENDYESKLGDFGVRKFDAMSNRFTTPEPLIDMFPGRSPYNYAGNCPLNYTDGSGFAYFFV